jgi:hypothetical protein
MFHYSNSSVAVIPRDALRCVMLAASRGLFFAAGFYFLLSLRVCALEPQMSVAIVTSTYITLYNSHSNSKFSKKVVQ